MIRSQLLSLVCLLSFVGPVAGETSARGIAIRLFAVALARDQGPVTVLVGQSRGPSFEIPTRNLSQPQIVTARDFLLVSAAVSKETPVRPLAKVHLPDEGSDFRIILVPAPDGTYQAVVVRGDDPKFACGDAFFINLSTHDILGNLGSTRLNLKSSDREILRLTGAESGGFFEVKFARFENAKLLPVAETRWPVLRNNRSYIIFHNGKNDRPTYRAVDEFMPLAIAGRQ